MKLHIASYSSSCSHHFSLSCLSFKPFKPYFDRPGTGQPQPPTFLAESPADPPPSCFQRMHSARRCHSLVMLVTLEHIIYEGVVASLVNRDGGLLLQKSPTHVLINSMKHITLFLRNRTTHQPTYHLSPTLIFMDTDSVVNRHQQQQLPVNLKHELNIKSDKPSFRIPALSLQ